MIRKWLKIIQDDSRWFEIFEMIRDDFRLLEIIRYDSKIIRDDSRWFEDDSRLLKMIRWWFEDYSRLFDMIQDDLKMIEDD